MNADPNLFVCGFNDGYISTFDLIKTQFTSNLKTYKIDKNDKHHYDKAHYQPNCLITGTLQTIYGGFEDSSIKSFDFRSCKIILFYFYKILINVINLLNY